MDKGLFFFFFFFWITSQLICNFVDGNAMFTSTNVADLSGSMSSSTTMSTDTSGTPAIYVSMGNTFFEKLNKLVFFDYTVFRNIDGTANDFVIFRYMLIVVGIVMLITAAIAFRSIFSG